MSALLRLTTGLWLLILLALPTAAMAAGKVAIVIGNGAYSPLPALANPPNDANLMASKLSGLGFEVIRIVDGTRKDFYEGLTQFGRLAQGADVALVFYAGHGVQVDGRNWLLPVDAEIETSTDLPAQAIKATDLLEIMDISGARLKLVFFDACRNNPLPRSLSRGASNGLARLEANAAGMMIAFATAPGDTALDGSGSNSPFTEALARLIDTPDLEVRHLLGRVRESVYTSTGERQLPWVNEALIGEFYFGGKTGDGTKPDGGEGTHNALASAEPEGGDPSVLATTRHQPAPRVAGGNCVPASAPGGSWQICASSVLDPQYGNRYGPANLTDGNLSTAWVEGISGNGTGEKVLFTFPRPRLLAGFEIVNGYAKNQDIFRKNARIKTARITLSDNTEETISLLDTMKSRRYTFTTPVETTWLELEIGSVFPGSKYQDTALTEFVPLFAD